MKQLTDQAFAQVREASVKAEDCIQAMTDGPHRGDWGNTLDVLEKALAALDTAQPVQVNAMLVEALEEARNGLAWYQAMYPGATDGSDDEAMERIDAAIAGASNA